MGDMAAELLRDFLAEAPLRIAELLRARSERNADELKKQVHSLKGTSAIFGAAATSEQCEKIQARVAAGDRDGDPWAELDAQVDDLVGKLEKACSVLAGRL